ncbi:MAG: NAD(P)(+) transhydrogenase (Re/Si-specific) subunit beta, partial [Acidobacteriota bacterium]
EVSMIASVFNITTLFLICGILLGIKLMSSPRTARFGNLMGALCILGSIALTLVVNDIVSRELLWISMIIGAVIGYIFALKVAMTQMPQLVALLNGFGGAASAIVAIITMTANPANLGSFTRFTAVLALAVGSVTFSGSMVAAAKLDRRISHLPVILKGHMCLSILLLIILTGLIVTETLIAPGVVIWIVTLAAALIFGIIMSVRIGGADMPITISLLNSLSGLAASIAGFAIGNPLLVAVGAIVGSAGLFLTQIMCQAMNRRLMQILTGREVSVAAVQKEGTPEDESSPEEVITSEPVQRSNQLSNEDLAAGILRQASRIIIVPGYGMALGQAQHQVKAIFDKLQQRGKEVLFGIHLVAGRMPGHMSLLLVEAGVPFDKLVQMKDANQKFSNCDVVLIVGANDIVNPAAKTAEGTPIYGMPILNVTEAEHVIVCNMDTSPGYAGVNNPLYQDSETITLLLGNAAETLESLMRKLD